MDKKYIVALVMCLSLTHCAFAQHKGNKKSDTTKVLEKDLSGVVISASKENLNYREIPVSVTLMASHGLENNEIKSLSNLSAVVPNIFMLQYGSKYNGAMYIRGIGSKTAAPSVGLYVDNVPYFEKTAFEFDFFDIDRIEILRGPQGTLFGRNTMGGVINITTKSPLYYQGTKINLSAATYGTYTAGLSHYGKVSDKFAYSLGVNYLHNDGFFTNAYTGNKADKLNSVGLRNRVVWKFNDRCIFENIANFEYSEQDGYPYAIYNGKTGNVLPVNYNIPSFYNRKMFSDAFVAKYYTNKINITSTTAYQFVDDVQDVDQDFTPANMYRTLFDPLQHVVSQEIIVKNDNKNKYGWLIGVYGFYQHKKTRVLSEQFIFNRTLDNYYKDNTFGGSLFGQFAIRNLWETGLTLTAGLRYDNEKYIYDIEENQVQKGKTTQLNVGHFSTLSSNILSPKVSLSYEFENINIYATISKGYKTGGYNKKPDKPENLEYKPEVSWNYEIGSKASFGENRLLADLSLFFIDWTNQQITRVNKTAQGGGVTTINAGQSRSIGLETSVKYMIMKNLDATLSYGYTDAKYKTFVYEVNAVTLTTKDYNNNYIAFVPQNTLSLQLNKWFDVNAKIVDKIGINLLYKGMGKLYWNDANDFSQPFYSLLDAKISFIKDRFEIACWAKNLLNQKYNAYYFEMQQTQSKYIQLGKPVQIGINLSVKL